MKIKNLLFIISIISFLSLFSSNLHSKNYSVARLWNEVMLEAIRNDFARPPIHARNLYHLSVAMWDAWATYEDSAIHVLSREPKLTVTAKQKHQEEAISYAAYKILVNRYINSPGSIDSLNSFKDLMGKLGYSIENTSASGFQPSAVGNRIALEIINHGYEDGSDEQGSYAFGKNYVPINEPLIVDKPGTTNLSDPNRWQPLSLRLFIDQAGIIQSDSTQKFIGPHWGKVNSFALPNSILGHEGVFYDPGPPPYLNSVTFLRYQKSFSELLRYSSKLSPDDLVMIDISPSSKGNNTLGKNDGNGYIINPITEQPYNPNLARRGDWTRVISEFWADGPDSETPPGHWNALANRVTDHPKTIKKIKNDHEEISLLEWDVKLYLALNGALHDAAISAWGIKGYYDYVRPITAIRYMAELGQSSDPELPSYHKYGLKLESGLVELITESSTQPNFKHSHLSDHIDEIAVYAWRGIPEDPHSEYSGVGWILALEWVPYQRDTFVTPPFAGYISGHSTFSRAAAEVLTQFTGSKFFPGGIAEYTIPIMDYLAFEVGPLLPVTLQWATYYDAADEAGISRLYGGIHPDIDDLPGRIIGSKIGLKAFERALSHYN